MELSSQSSSRRSASSTFVSAVAILFLATVFTQCAAILNISDGVIITELSENRYKQADLPLVRLTRDLLARDKYDKRVRPVADHTKTLPITISMSLYQIIEVDEPSQNIKLNVWMIQRWKDEFLTWNPDDYGGIDRTVLPFHVLWIPDTYLYNSVKMARDETERYMNIQVESLYNKGENGSYLSFLYPAIYTVTCRLNIRYFPYDQQNCTLTISSWTNSKSALDYYSDPAVNLASFIPNEEWTVISFDIHRHEYKYACCAEPWVILQASLVIRRKPLYYLVNLIIPTSIITLVAITGFFTPASTDDDRTEKINLGITTLLAMSILMLMVSDQMPTTSEFVPLIGWFYLSIIIIISIGTFLTSVILSIQGRRQYGRCPTPMIRRLFFIYIIKLVWLDVPLPLKKMWEDMDDHPRTKKQRGLRRAIKSKCRDVENNNMAVSLSQVTDRPSSRLGTLRVPPLSSTTVGTGACAVNGGDKRGSIQEDMETTATLSLSGTKWKLLKDTMIDVSVPPSPMIRTSRQGSLWDGAVQAMTGRGSAGQSRGGSLFGGADKEINYMKKQRQVSLEWEFLATILDRILLIAFVMAVLLITLGLMVTGRMAQAEYDRKTN